MIVTGPIDDLFLNFQGRFATLTTNDIFCEQTQDGYNSSIMLFNVFQKKVVVPAKDEEEKEGSGDSDSDADDKDKVKHDNKLNLTKSLKLVSQVQVLYETLFAYYDHVMKFMMRFDHYLEMLVWNADIVQEICPGLVLDYT